MYYYPNHYILLAFITVITSLLYFRKEKSSLKEGFILGVVYVGVALILDAIITVPFFIKEYTFFLDIMLLFGLVEIVGVASIVGYILSRS